MCGIFGAIGAYSTDKLKVLALLNENRGEHSCGFFDGQFLVKKTKPISKMLKHPKLNKVRPQFVFGHARFATMGNVSERNAHPFQYGHITGAHNGMIYNFENVRQEGMQVDSEVIFWGLSQYGTDFFKRLDGYWGLVWHDSRSPDFLYLMRHNCELAIAEEEKAIYFSSDINDLKKAGLTAKELKENCVYVIDPSTLAISKWKIKGLKKNKKKIHWGAGLDYHVEWDEQRGPHGNSLNGNYLMLCENCGSITSMEKVDVYGFCTECQELREDEFGSHWQT